MGKSFLLKQEGLFLWYWNFKSFMVAATFKLRKERKASASIRRLKPAATNFATVAQGSSPAGALKPRDYQWQKEVRYF